MTSSCITTEDRAIPGRDRRPVAWASSAARPCRPTGCSAPGTTIPTSTRGSCPSTRSRRAPFGAPCEVKYLRTIATQLFYWPLLLRELRGPTSSTSSPPRTSRSCWRRCRRSDRAAARQAGRHELPQRRGARSSAALGHRARHAALGRSERRAVARSSRTSSRLRHQRRDHSEHRRRRALPFPEREPLAPADPVDAQLRSALQRRLHAARVPPGAGPLSGRDADAGRRGIRGRSDCARWRASCGSQHVHVRRPRARRTTSGATTPTPTSTCRRPTSTTCRPRCSRRSRAAARCLHRRRRRPGDPDRRPARPARPLRRPRRPRPTRSSGCSRIRRSCAACTTRRARAARNISGSGPRRSGWPSTTAW